MIAIAAICNLTLGGIAGAVCFAVGLCAICQYKFQLFTGWCGKFWSYKNKRRFTKKMAVMWLLNYLGAWGLAKLVSLTPVGLNIQYAATLVIAKYVDYDWWQLLLLSIPCGLLVYLGVTSAQEHRPLLVLCVIAFVIGGFPHCIATMAYLGLAYLGQDKILIAHTYFDTLLLITVGNIIGSWIGYFSTAQFRADHMAKNH